MDNFSEFLKEYQESDKIGLLSLQNGGVYNSINTVKHLKQVSGQNPMDMYMSMNPLVCRNRYIKRDKEHIGRLKWLYVDLDYYNSCYRDYTKSQIYGLLEMDYFGQSIPQPSYVIDSGRGLYLLWKIDEHINAYSRWVKMQEYLSEKLSEFGADKKVTTDSARVLRRIGSINTKSGTMVTVIAHQAVKYSLTNLVREYIVGDSPSEKMCSYAMSIAEILNLALPDMKNRDSVQQFIRENKEPATLFSAIQKAQKPKKQPKQKIAYIGTEYSLLSARIRDLEKLLLLHRDREGGSREYILFLYRYWNLCASDDKEESLKKTLQLNSKLKNPLEEKEVLCATKSAEKYYAAGKTFRIRNTSVINVLAITETEMKDLSIFIGSAERKVRKKDRNRNTYLHTLKKQGKITKEEGVKRRREKVYRLLLKGKTEQEICRQMNISRATFYADKRQIGRLCDTLKRKKAALHKAYREYAEKIRERCLKFSAFVLNMSFRTSRSLSLWSQGVFSSPSGSCAGGYLACRSLTSWTREQLYLLSHPWKLCWQGPASVFWGTSPVFPIRI